jgi:hypothetical protein
MPPTRRPVDSAAELASSCACVLCLDRPGPEIEVQVRKYYWCRRLRVSVRSLAAPDRRELDECGVCVDVLQATSGAKHSLVACSADLVSAG